MRVNGRTKPTGAMKVIGPIPRRAGGRAHPDGVTDFPPRDGAEPRFRSRTPSSPGSGGAGPGLAMTNGRRRLLLGGGLPASGCVGGYPEHKCWDPKDSELCLARMKPGETLVEVRSVSDVQIDRQS